MKDWIQIVTQVRINYWVQRFKVEYKINNHLQQGLKHSEDMSDFLRCSFLHTPLFSLDKKKKTWISVKPKVIVFKAFKNEHIFMQLMKSAVTKTTVLKTSSSWSFFQSWRLKGSIPITLSHSKAASGSAILWLSIFNLQLERKWRNNGGVSVYLVYYTEERLHNSLPRKLFEFPANSTNQWAKVFNGTHIKVLYIIPLSKVKWLF